MYMNVVKTDNLLNICLRFFELLCSINGFKGLLICALNPYFKLHLAWPDVFKSVKQTPGNQFSTHFKVEIGNTIVVFYKVIYYIITPVIIPVKSPVYKLHLFHLAAEKKIKFLLNPINR